MSVVVELWAGLWFCILVSRARDHRLRAIVVLHFDLRAHECGGGVMSMFGVLHLGPHARVFGDFCARLLFWILVWAFWGVLGALVVLHCILLCVVLA